MPDFLLLLHEDPTNWRTVSPEEMQRALEQYFAWTKKPFVLGHEHLAEDVGKVIRSRDGVPRSADGPYSESKEVLAGFRQVRQFSWNRTAAEVLEVYTEVAGRQ